MIARYVWMAVLVAVGCKKVEQSVPASQPLSPSAPPDHRPAVVILGTSLTAGYGLADPATQAYGLTGIFHERLKVSVPFDIEIDLTAVDRRGR